MGRVFFALAALLLAACGKVEPKEFVPPAPPNITASVEPMIDPRPCVVITAEAEIGVKEVGTNSGPRVNEYLASTKLGPGFPWCAAFCHWTFRQCGTVLEPAREYAAAAKFAKVGAVFRKGELDRYISQQRISEDGDLFTLYYSSLGRVGHVGMIIGEDEDDVTTIEGNGSVSGSREGTTVVRRTRDKETLYTVNHIPR